MPFLRRKQHWTKFAEKGRPHRLVETKDREILYASRRDSFIFSHYRSELERPYEDELVRRNLQECVTAYRKISTSHGRGGKCNIHFAKDAFNLIRELKNCTAFALDIKGFFENLDHEHLKQTWLGLLHNTASYRNITRLPEDHFKVFRAVTNYSWIDRNAAYSKLGLIGKVPTRKGKAKIGYTKSRKDFPLRIGEPNALRDEFKGLINVNKNPFGIPQGSPISDLLANLYMLDFDSQMKGMATQLDGRYFRYSDDILLLLPTNSVTGCDQLILDIENTLRATAPRLRLKAEKTLVYEYISLGDGDDQANRKLRGRKSPDGLEYLGFRYDGRRVFIRNSTVSGNHRKITYVANRMARKFVEHNPTMSLKELKNEFNYGLLIEKFGRIKDFDPSARRYKSWTFWTYTKRAIDTFNPMSAPIKRQVSGYKSLTRKKAEKALTKAYRAHHNRRMHP